MEPRQEPPAPTPGGPRQGEPRQGRAVLAVALLTGLLALVAIGSGGRAPAGLGGRRPSYVVVDTIVSLALVVLALGIVVAGYVVVSEREYLVAQRRAKGPRRTLLGAGLALALVVIGLYVHGSVGNRHGTRTPNVAIQTPSAGAPKAAGQEYQPHFAAAPVLLVLGICLSVALAAYLSHRSRRRDRGGQDVDAALTLTLADILGDTLDDLRAEPDPRRAVIAAYARLERTLAAVGLARDASEAPDEYLHRILVDLDVSSRSARKLTQLFSRAKFSQHDVGPAMKEEAIRLLETIRDDLREDEDRRSAGERPREAAAW